jgi:hypothetical protein
MKFMLLYIRESKLKVEKVQKFGEKVHRPGQ